MVFLHGRASEAAHILKAARRTVGAGLRCGAVELLQPEIDLKDIPEYQALERCVVRVHQTLVVFDRLRERLTWEPRPHVFVIKCVGHTQHVGAGVLRVIIHAAAAKVATAARLKINP